MPDDRPAIPAEREHLVQTLSFGLQFSTTGKAHRHGNGLAAKLAAEMLVQHLEQAGFIVMSKPPSRGTTPLPQGAPGKPEPSDP